MSRRRVIAKRKLTPDARFKSTLIAKFINLVMKNGKKSKAQHVVYGALEKLAGRLNGDPVELFEKALENIKPIVEVRSRRVGGATYQVPVEVRPIRAITLAMRWLLQAAAKRTEKGMINRLLNELIDASQNKGAAVKVKQDKEKMAEANKAFANYRWT